MKRRFFASLVLALLASSSFANEVKKVDSTFVPGKHLGPVTKETTLAQLKTLFGAKNVKEEDIAGPEGDSFAKGARVLKGTNREFLVRFDEEVTPMKAEYAWIIGSFWSSELGISTKTTIAELEKLNGKPFIISGFGWEFGGYCSFGEGKVGDHISIRLNSSDLKLPDDFYGDTEIRSNDKRLLKVNPPIQSIGVVIKEWEE